MSSLSETTGASNFIWASLSALRQECPQAYQLMCRQLAGHDLLLVINDEPVGLRFTTEHAAPLAINQGTPPDLRLLTSWSTIFDLVDARLTFIDAALQGCLVLYGGTAELALLYEAILTYLRGAVRCLSFSPLLEQARLAHS